MTLEVSPQAALGFKIAPHNHSVVTEVLIQWTDVPAFEATWEDATLLALRFPVFHHEDKVAVWQEGNAKAQAQHTSPLLTYKRRKKKTYDSP